MPGPNAIGSESAKDRSRSILDHAHALLSAPAGVSPEASLAELARVSGADSAGLARPDGTVFASIPAEPAARLPWEQQPALLASLKSAAFVRTRTPDGAEWLMAVGGSPGGVDWLLWLEAKGTTWTASEGAALAVAAQLIGRHLWTRPEASPAVRQRRLEAAADASTRIAHDFGNILTPLVGFTELALADLSNPSRAHGYLTEVRRAVEHAIRFTTRLRLFARPGQGMGGPAVLAGPLRSEVTRVGRAAGEAVRIHLDLPADLPPIALDPELLRILIAELLDNAREAVGRSGTVSVRTRAATLSVAECLELYGNPVPGPCVEVTIEDNGPGLTPEARKAVFAELLFSTRPKQRGLGLPLVVGILRANRGGLRLDPRPERGTTARLFLPVDKPNGLPTAKANLRMLSVPSPA